jgi:hypothetical protein
MEKLVYESLDELNEDWKSKIAKGLVGAAFVGSMTGLPSCSSKTSDNYDKTEQTFKTNDKNWKHKAYKNIFDELSKHYYLKNAFIEGPSSMYYINDNKTGCNIVGNEENINNIKRDIMKYLQSEPTPSKEDKLGYHSLEWTTKEYTLELSYKIDQTQVGPNNISLLVME